VPRFDKITPVLKASDMQRSVDFYTGVLGFALQWRGPGDGGDEICMLQLGEANLMLSTGNHLSGKPCFTGTLYFDMQGVDEFYARIKDKLDLVWPLEAMEYGQREFGLRDPDGYTLAFAERLRR
jgi:catechol 2,3-dioxygenase-like lactoylglutathione lyase family enzyme